MKICVLVPSEDHLATAGVRIRYERIGAGLRARGHELSVMVIDNVLPLGKQLADIYLLCKCHDARSLILAAELRARGIHLGADFFDDYYTLGGDSRFVHIREWLRDIGPYLTFALCSTPPMQESLRSLLPHLPCHMMNDPYDAVDSSQLGQAIARKIDKVNSTGILDIGWFGIGDNPHFAVGLSDLKDFGWVLDGFNRAGLQPRLSILTNRRAMTPDRLALLTRLPVPYRLEEWTEAGEHQLVQESYVCFLPVNAQRFSIVKSLNRCVTALTGGSQVLTAGYPLYADMGDYIYSGSHGVIADIAAGTPRLRQETLPGLLALMRGNADPQQEAAGLAAFLESLGSPVKTGEGAPFLAVIHGRLSTGLVHKFAQRLGHISVAGPWSPAALNYDVKVGRIPGGPAGMQLSEKALKRLRPEHASRVEIFTASDGRKIPFLPLNGALGDLAEFQDAARLGFDSVLIAEYSYLMNAAGAAVNDHFDVTAIVHSEYAPPYWNAAKRRPSGPQAALALETR